MTITCERFTVKLALSWNLKVHPQIISLKEHSDKQVQLCKEKTTLGKDEKIYIGHSETKDISKSFTNEPLSWYFGSVLQHLFPIYMLECLVGDVGPIKNCFNAEAAIQKSLEKRLFWKWCGMPEKTSVDGSYIKIGESFFA